MHGYFAALTASLMVAVGATHAEPLTTAGVGLASCEKLASDLNPEQGFNHLPNALVYYWVQGYMSAAKSRRSKPTAIMSTFPNTTRK